MIEEDLSIGKELAKARHKKGISIKDAEEATKIRAKFLEALENDDFENVPEPVYIKGFIRTYATFLGTNSYKLVNKYQELLKEERERQASLLEDDDKNNDVRGCEVNPINLQPKLIKASKKKAPLLIILFTIVAVIVILGILGTVAPQPRTKEIVLNKHKTIPNGKKRQKKEKTKKTPVIPGIFISVIANRSTWIKVNKDGLLYFVGVLKAKKKLKVHAVKNVEVITVDGSALTIYKNHKFQGLMSKNKGPLKKSYVAQEASISEGKKR